MSFRQDVSKLPGMGQKIKGIGDSISRGVLGGEVKEIVLQGKEGEEPKVLKSPVRPKMLQSMMDLASTVAQDIAPARLVAFFPNKTAIYGIDRPPVENPPIGNIPVPICVYSVQCRPGAEPVVSLQQSTRTKISLDRWVGDMYGQDELTQRQLLHTLCGVRDIQDPYFVRGGAFEKPGSMADQVERYNQGNIDNIRIVPIGIIREV
jgi:hypothetical protein